MSNIWSFSGSSSDISSLVWWSIGLLLASVAVFWALCDNRFFIYFLWARGPTDLSANVSSANSLWLNRQHPLFSMLWIIRVVGVHVF